MKKITIIGAGITGLSAGIHALQKGYHVEIYEKNNFVGGYCTGWYRKNYYIDNCMHWLTGTNQHTELFKLWKNLNAINETSNLYQSDYFYKSILNTDQISLYYDLDKTKKEMLQLSKEDKKEINKFINTIKIIAESNKNHNIFYKSYLKSKGYFNAYNYYHKLNLYDLGNKFKHPLLKLLFTDYLPGEYNSLALICAYATFASGNGKIYSNGSKEFAENIAIQFIKQGGVIHLNKTITNINIIDDKIDTLEINNKEIINVDKVIYTGDPYYLFNNMLDLNYIPKELQNKFNNKLDYPPISSYHCAFLLDKSKVNFKDSVIISIPRTKIANGTISRLLIKDYSYLYPNKEKTVIQFFIPQSYHDFEYWEKLSHNKIEYNNYKTTIAENIKSKLINSYPNLTELELIDSWTPYTYKQYYNSYYGSYMGFVYTKKGKLKKVTTKVDGIKNLFLATYWQRITGGLPVAAQLGKEISNKI